MNKAMLALVMMAVATPMWAAETPAQKPEAQMPDAQKPAAMTDEQVIEAFRSDMQAKRADVMAKALTLTADQAAKFWPLFEQYQKEQNKVIEAQMEAVLKFTKNYKNLSDADALAYINALVDRDEEMAKLRIKWLAKFQEAVPVKTAVRAIHIDRRLSQVAQVKLSSSLPLVN